MKARHLLIATALVAAGASAGIGLKSVLAGGIPDQSPLFYAGTLIENGQLVTGQRALTVNVWADPMSMGAPLCQTVASTAQVQNGRFRIALDGSCKGQINKNSNAWVEVIDGATSLGRAKIGAVPYAVETDHSTNADNATNASDGGTLAQSLATMQSDISQIQQADMSFVDLASQQTISGSKTFSNLIGGTRGGSGLYIRTRAGTNGVSFNWDGSNLHFFVEDVNVATLASSGATAKTFVIPHPTDKERYLVHATLEGPESAVYYRGTGRLHHGRAEVVLPAYFEAMAREEGRTVLVTPIFDSNSERVSALAASHVVRGAFQVRGIDSNNPNQAFDWEVKAVRADVQPLVVEPRRQDVLVRGDGPYTYIAAQRTP
jgi:hypothetical protein